MAQQKTLVGRDLFIKTTQPDGKSTVSHHRVWDADRFLAAQQSEAISRAHKENTAPDVVVSATADDYRRSRRA